VTEFARLDAYELLLATEKAIGDASLYNTHQELITKREGVKQLEQVWGGGGGRWGVLMVVVGQRGKERVGAGQGSSSSWSRWVGNHYSNHAPPPMPPMPHVYFHHPPHASTYVRNIRSRPPLPPPPTYPHPPTHPPTHLYQAHAALEKQLGRAKAAVADLERDYERFRRRQQLHKKIEVGVVSSGVGSM
jgi:hypothetical protein